MPSVPVARALACESTGWADRSRASVETPVELEIPLVALGLLLLAIHGVNLVAEEQVQVLVAAARQFFFDGLELEKKVEPERADQRQPGILGMAEFLDDARRNGNTEGCLLRSSSENSFGRGCRRPRSAEPYRPNESQCGCDSRTGSSI